MHLFFPPAFSVIFLNSFGFEKVRVCREFVVRNYCSCKQTCLEIALTPGSKWQPSLQTAFLPCSFSLALWGGNRPSLDFQFRKVKEHSFTSSQKSRTVKIRPRDTLPALLITTSCTSLGGLILGAASQHFCMWGKLHSQRCIHIHTARAQEKADTCNSWRSKRNCLNSTPITAYSSVSLAPD